MRFCLISSGFQRLPDKCSYMLATSTQSKVATYDYDRLNDSDVNVLFWSVFTNHMDSYID